MPVLRPIVIAVLAVALSAIAPVRAAEHIPSIPVGTPASPPAIAPFSSLVVSPTHLRLPAAIGPAHERLDLRRSLVALAMKLRDVRYVRGGHSPATGFDCSGFVRYVFARAVGVRLPANSAAQFRAGAKVTRADMRPGDLVFFHTRGRKRISHVGIYLDNGRFIHSPSAGKSVEVSRLDEAYWAKRFAGARRPEGMASNG